MSRGELFNLHLCGILNQFLPPILIGYLLWNQTSTYEIQSCLERLIENMNLLEAMQVTMDSTSSTSSMYSASSMGDQIVEASSP